MMVLCYYHYPTINKNQIERILCVDLKGHEFDWLKSFIALEYNFHGPCAPKKFPGMKIKGKLFQGQVLFYHV